MERLVSNTLYRPIQRRMLVWDGKGIPLMHRTDDHMKQARPWLLAAFFSATLVGLAATEAAAERAVVVASPDGQVFAWHLDTEGV